MMNRIITILISAIMIFSFMGAVSGGQVYAQEGERDGNREHEVVVTEEYKWIPITLSGLKRYKIKPSDLEKVLKEYEAKQIELPELPPELKLKLLELKIPKFDPSQIPK